VRKLIPYCKDACEGAIPALLACMEDPAPQVRQYAIKALAEWFARDRQGSAEP